jgi:hypothetical protein
MIWYVWIETSSGWSGVYPVAADTAEHAAEKAAEEYHFDVMEYPAITTVRVSSVWDFDAAELYEVCLDHAEVDHEPCLVYTARQLSRAG